MKLHQADWYEAQLFHEDAIRMAKKGHDRLTMGRSHAHLSDVYCALGEYDQAKEPNLAYRHRPLSLTMYSLPAP